MSAVRQEREEISSLLESFVTCGEDGREAECSSVDISSEGDDASLWEDADDNVRILLIDGARNCNLMKSPSEGRYKNRIRARYSLTESGTYTECIATSAMPRGASRIIHGTAGSRRFVPAAGLDLAAEREVSEKFPALRDWFSHGNLCLVTMAEHTPQATFVLAEIPEYGPTELMCHGGSRETVQYNENLARGLREIVETHHIKYILYSAGATFAATRRTVDAGCGAGTVSDERVDALYRASDRWVRELSNIPNVFFIQAAVSIPDGSDLRGYDLDCVKDGYRNRIRVGHFNAPDADFDQRGADIANARWRQTVARDYKNCHGCIDLFINSGLFAPDPGKWRQVAGRFAAPELNNVGIGADSMMFMSSSYIAPYALSYIINAVMTGGDPDPPKLLDELTAGGTRVMHDPIRNENFESYRLGKAWFRDETARCEATP